MKLRITSIFTHRIYASFICIIILIIPFNAFAQESGKNYNDGHGKQVFIPNGDISFADAVVSFTKGNPSAIDSASLPSDCIGLPDFNGSASGFLSLGCGGILILKFLDNVLINIDGPDLYVFELGKHLEPTDLSISKDGINWIAIGEISGAKAEVDISKFTRPGDVFNYVRLVDLKTDCRGKWPGADIDAVATIGSAKKISLSGSVLFGINEAVLKLEAKKILLELLDEMNNTSIGEIRVEGYSDNLGDDVRNTNLSLERAIAVKKFLTQKVSNKNVKINALGLGESNPLFSNDTKEGQEKNRRVEIILMPL